MRWALATLVAALTAVVAVNVLLLGYSGDRHDPVGRLSPVADLVVRTVKARPLPPPPTTTVRAHAPRTNGSESDD